MPGEAYTAWRRRREQEPLPPAPASAPPEGQAAGGEAPSLPTWAPNPEPSALPQIGTSSASPTVGLGMVAPVPEPVRRPTLGELLREAPTPLDEARAIWAAQVAQASASAREENPLSRALGALFGAGQEYVGQPVMGLISAGLNPPEARAAALNAWLNALGGTAPWGSPQVFRAEDLAPARPELELRVPGPEAPPLERLAALYQEARRVEQERPEAFPLEKVLTEGILLNPLTYANLSVLPPGSLRVLGPSGQAMARYEQAARAVAEGRATEAQQRLAAAVPALMETAAGGPTPPEISAQVEALARQAAAAERAANPRYFPTAAERAAARAQKLRQREEYLAQALGRRPTAEEVASGLMPRAAGGEIPPLPTWAPAAEGLGLPMLPPGPARAPAVGQVAAAARGAAQSVRAAASPVLRTLAEERGEVGLPQVGGEQPAGVQRVPEPEASPGFTLVGHAFRSTPEPAWSGPRLEESQAAEAEAQRVREYLARRGAEGLDTVASWGFRDGIMWGYGPWAVVAEVPDEAVFTGREVDETLFDAGHEGIARERLVLNLAAARAQGVEVTADEIQEAADRFGVPVEIIDRDEPFTPFDELGRPLQVVTPRSARGAAGPGAAAAVEAGGARAGAAPGAAAAVRAAPETPVGPVQRPVGRDEAGYEREVANIRAAYERHVAAGEWDAAERTRGMIQLGLQNLALERAMNDALWRYTGRTPDQATEETWRRTVDAIDDRLNELLQRYTREGIEGAVQLERGATPEPGYAFGREVTIHRGAFSRREAQLRMRDRYRQAMNDIGERYGRILEEAGYRPEELVGLSARQRQRLVQEIAEGRLLRTASGKPAQIGDVSADRRGEVIVAASPDTAVKARRAAQDLFDAPGLDARQLFETAEAIRAFHLGERAEIPEMEPYPEDVARWLPEPPQRPAAEVGESGPLQQQGLPGVPVPPGKGPAAGPQEPLPTGWLPRVPDNEAILARAYRGGRLAQALRAIGRKYPDLGRVISAGGLPLDDPQVQAYILRENILADWNAAVTGAMARLRSLGTSRELFDVDENELAHLPSRSPVALYDLLERPKGYRLTPQQRQWIDTLYRLTDEGRAAMELNGIEVPTRKMEPGAHYVGRRVLGRLDPESNTIEVGVIARGPGAGGGRVQGMAQVDEADLYGPMIGRRGEFELARAFDSHAAALEAGFRYLTPEETLQLNLQYIGRRIADERMKRVVLEQIPHRPLPVWRDEAGVWQTGGVRFGEAQIPGPSFRDVAFLARDVARLRELLGQRAPDVVQRGAEFVASANALPRMMMTTFDLGAAFGQLQTVLLSRPRQWATAVRQGFAAFTGERTFQRYLAANAEVINEAAMHGLDLTPSEFTEAARWGERLGLKRGTVEEAARSPLGEAAHAAAERVAQGYRALTSPFERMYEAQLTAAKLELYKALRPLAESDEDLDAIARHCNLLTLGLNTRRLGLSPRQRAVEAAVAFAPRMYRAALALLSDVARGDLKGRLARESLARIGIASLLGYLGLCGLLGQRPNLDPRSSRFMTIELGGQHLGLGGVLYATTRTLLGMALDAGQAAVTAGKVALKLAPADEGWQGPLAKAVGLGASWARSRLSPALGALVDLGLGRDAAGRPVPIGRPLDLLRDTVGMRLMPIWLSSLAEDQRGTPAQKAAKGLAEFAGLRTFPVAAWEERNELRERYAREEFGRPWAELDALERYRVAQAHPDLAEATLRAVQESADRGALWAQFELDVEAARQPYRDEIQALGEALRAGQISGNAYRDEVARREALIAEVPEVLRRSRAYEGLQEPGGAGRGDPAPTAGAGGWGGETPGGETPPLQGYLERYYRASQAAMDPATGRVDMELRAQLLDLLDAETDPAVVARAREYLARERDPEYVQAQAEWREYLAIPKYLGLDEEQTRRADHAAEMILALRAQMPGLPYNAAWAIYARQDPEGAVLARVAERLRNPARRYYYATHPLLAKFYGDLSWADLQLVQLPALAPAVGE